MYIPVLVAALAVLILGWWKPKFLQHKKNGGYTGHTWYLWLALGALIFGALAVWIMSCQGVGACRR